MQGQKGHSERGWGWLWYHEGVNAGTAPGAVGRCRGTANATCTSATKVKDKEEGRGAVPEGRESEGRLQINVEEEERLATRKS